MCNLATYPTSSILSVAMDIRFQLSSCVRVEYSPASYIITCSLCCALFLLYTRIYLCRYTCWGSVCVLKHFCLCWLYSWCRAFLIKCSSVLLAMKKPYLPVSVYRHAVHGHLLICTYYCLVSPFYHFFGTPPFLVSLCEGARTLLDVV